MKKFISMILATAFLLSFCGCITQKPIETPNGLRPEDSESKPVDGSETPTVTDPAAESSTPDATDPPEPAEPVLMYQAHRGVSTRFPENTLPAFQAAIDQGYKFIELDPNFTSDGRCILLHDTTLNRTCRNADGTSLSKDISVRSISYDELMKYDAGIFKGGRFKGTKVPLLTEVAELVTGTGVALKLDNKIQSYSDAELEVIFTIAEFSDADIGFTCKSIDFIRRVTKRLDDVTIHYDGPSTKTLFKSAKNAAGDNELYIWIGIDNATKELCDEAKKYGKLGIWILSTEDQLQRAIELGADVIETNGELKP